MFGTIMLHPVVQAALRFYWHFRSPRRDSHAGHSTLCIIMLCLLGRSCFAWAASTSRSSQAKHAFKFKPAHHALHGMLLKPTPPGEHPAGSAGCSCSEELGPSIRGGGNHSTGAGTRLQDPGSGCGQSAAHSRLQAFADGVPQQRRCLHQVGPVVCHKRRHLPCGEILILQYM